MEEHAVPQNITSYQFHLIGNMTIKQFLILLVGVVIGFLLYTTNLPAFIKWPVVFLVGGTVIGMAFVPYEDRSLDQWFVNFIKAIYHPTQYFWKRAAILPGYFSYNPRADASSRYAGPPIDLSKYRSQQVTQYLSTLHPTSTLPALDPLDLFSATASTNMSSLFNSVAPASGVTPGKDTKVITKPSLHVQPRRLGGVEVFRGVSSSQTVSFMPTPAQAAGDNQLDVFRQPGMVRNQTDNLAQVPSDSTRLAIHHEAMVAPSEKTVISTGLELGATEDPLSTATEEKVAAAYVSPAEINTMDVLTTPMPAVFNKDLPFPSLPTQNNILIGMVHNQQHAIVPGAIVEILDSEHNTVRAMKTNNLGQFYISTALKPGSYFVATEKDDLRFPTYVVEANNSVLLPIDISAV
jgi:hypothetical protein